MQYREMGRTGWQISEVSLGGAYLMGSDPKRAQESTDEVAKRAVELGINYIDTAPLYGKSEELLGGALEGIATLTTAEIASSGVSNGACSGYVSQNWGRHRSMRST